MKGSILIDSGAFSLYQQEGKGGSSTSVKGSTFGNRKYDDFSYIETDKYKKYRQDYANFLKKHKEVIDVAINLDVINNPKESYNNHQFLCNQGVDTIPVYHIGTDIEYLKKYLEYNEYIALGGMTPNPFKIVKPILDKLWKEYLIDKKGYPTVKVHGLAITSPNYLFTYPWYSCDSSGWIRVSQYGTILVPKKSRGEYDYRKTPVAVAVTKGRPREGSCAAKHIRKLSKMEQKYIADYLKDKGSSFGISKFKKVEEGYKLQDNEMFLNKEKTKVEIVIKEGIINNNYERDVINAIYYKDLGESIPKYPWPMKVKSMKGFY